LELVDVDGAPLGGERYRVDLPDGRVVEGALDAAGRARLVELPAGDCRVSFPRLRVADDGTAAPSSDEVLLALAGAREGVAVATGVQRRFRLGRGAVQRLEVELVDGGGRPWAAPPEALA